MFINETNQVLSDVERKLKSESCSDLLNFDWTFYINLLVKF